MRNRVPYNRNSETKESPAYMGVEVFPINALSETPRHQVGRQHRLNRGFWDATFRMIVKRRENDGDASICGSSIVLHSTRERSPIPVKTDDIRRINSV